MASDIQPNSSQNTLVRAAIVIGVAVVALVVANFIFNLVLTLIKAALFLAILAGVVWFGYRLIASKDSPNT